VATAQRGANGIELLGVGPQDGGHHSWHGELMVSMGESGGKKQVICGKKK
jgi:hypothetical protein